MLNLATSDGIFPRSFTIPAGSATPVQFDNANAAAIPDNSPMGVDSVVQVDGVMGRISDVTVSLHISHPNTRGWRQVEWDAFQQAGGDTWPAVGRLR